MADAHADELKVLRLFVADTARAVEKEIPAPLRPHAAVWMTEEALRVPIDAQK